MTSDYDCIWPKTNFGTKKKKINLKKSSTRSTRSMKMPEFAKKKWQKCLKNAFFSPFTMTQNPVSNRGCINAPPILTEKQPKVAILDKFDFLGLKYPQVEHNTQRLW